MAAFTFQKFTTDLNGENTNMYRAIFLHLGLWSDFYITLDLKIANWKENTLTITGHLGPELSCINIQNYLINSKAEFARKALQVYIGLHVPVTALQGRDSQMMQICLQPALR